MSRRRPPPPDAANIRRLIAYQLHRAAYFATRPSHLAHAREHGITPLEWRLLGHLQADGPQTPVQLATALDVLLAQVSRTVAGLVDRGLVGRSASAQDGRSVELALTPRGRALHDRLFEQSWARHEELLAVLAPPEQAQLLDWLDRLAQRGRRMLEEESARAEVQAPRRRRRST